jgi:hypothetical protein
MTKRSQKKRLPFKNRLVVLSIFILAAVTTIVGFTLHITESDRIGNTVTDNRKQYEPQSDTLRMDQIAAFKQAGIIDVSAATYSSKFDVCYIDSSTLLGGNSYQECYFRYVDLITTKLAVNDVVTRLGSVRNSVNVMGTSESYAGYFIGGCAELTRLEPNVTVGQDVHLPYTRTTSYFLDSGTSKDNNVLCATITPQRGNSIRIAVPESVGKFIAHQVRTFTISTVDTSRPYVLIETDSIYYHELLQCKAFTVFCDTSRNQTITGSWE